MALDYSNTPTIINGVTTEELIGENVAVPATWTLKDWLKRILAGPIPITTDIGDTKKHIESTTDLAVDATFTFNSATPTLITNGKLGQLRHIIVSSNIPLIVKIQSVDSTPATTVQATIFTTSAATTYEYKAELSDEITQLGAATNTKFQVEVTNNGNRPGAGLDGDNEIHCTIWWTEVTP